MTTKDKILQHLQSGNTITPLEALEEYETMSLPFFIYQLRQEGFIIQTDIKTTFQNKRYAEYTLIQE